MNKGLTIWFCLMGVFLTADLFSQNSGGNMAFQYGESLTYSVNCSSTFGDFNAGQADVDVQIGKINGQPIFHFKVIGETNNFFDAFYKVCDSFESKTNIQTLLPYVFTRSTREGKYSFDDEVYFDQVEGVAKSNRSVKQIPDKTYDVISAVYFMRTLSVEDFGTDSIYRLNFHLDDSVYQSVIKYEGKAVVETKWGWLPCLKVKPMLVLGEVFSNSYPMSVWITDDDNHIPVLAESEIVLGSVRMELVEYEGLKNPFIEPLSRKELREFK